MTPNPTRAARGQREGGARVMKKEDVGIVPITEGNGSTVVGVVTYRDIALYLGEKDRRPSEVRAPM